MAKRICERCKHPHSGAAELCANCINTERCTGAAGKLRACPFCAGRNLRNRWALFDDSVGRIVKCIDCGAAGPPRPTNDDAREAWNCTHD